MPGYGAMAQATPFARPGMGLGPDPSLALPVAPQLYSVGAGYPAYSMGMGGASMGMGVGSPGGYPAHPQMGPGGMRPDSRVIGRRTQTAPLLHVPPPMPSERSLAPPSLSAFGLDHGPMGLQQPGRGRASAPLAGFGGGGGGSGLSVSSGSDLTPSQQHYQQQQALTLAATTDMDAAFASGPLGPMSGGPLLGLSSPQQQMRAGPLLGPRGPATMRVAGSSSAL